MTEKEDLRITEIWSATTYLRRRPHSGYFLLVHDEELFTFVMFHLQFLLLLAEFGLFLLLVLQQGHLLLFQFGHQLVNLA